VSKGIVNYREFRSSHEIGGQAAKVENILSFDDIQTFLQNRMSDLTWFTANDREYIHESNGSRLSKSEAEGISNPCYRRM
jgi:hypothetical protein